MESIATIKISFLAAYIAYSDDVARTDEESAVIFYGLKMREKTAIRTKARSLGLTPLEFCEKEGAIYNQITQ